MSHPPVTELKKSDAGQASGAIVSTMLYYEGNQMYCLQLCALDYLTENYVFLQELIPSKVQLEVRTFTTYDESSRTITVLADHYPSAASATFWVSTLNEFVNVSTPALTEVTIQFPVSRSPFPLDVAPLQISRMLNIGNGKRVAIFTNGEVHEIDLVNKQFTFLYSLISDEKQLSVSFPAFVSGHVYDASTDRIWSIVEEENQFYAMSSQVTAAGYDVSPWVQLKLPSNMLQIVAFSPESTMNMHAVVAQDGGPVKILVQIASITNNAGFDLIVFVDTESGQLSEYPSGNMMSENCMFLCDATNMHDCDFWQNSAWDQVHRTLYFQGHYIDPQSGQPTTKMFYLTFDDNKINGNLTWYFNTYEEMPFGIAGFQYVSFV